MSANNTINGPYNPVVQPFVDFWSAYFKQVDDATRDFLDGLENGSGVKIWQRRWADTVSKSTDAYMRSPEFLRAMKQNTDLAVKAKRQFDDLACEIARNANIPTAADVSGLFERLHSIEEIILSRLNNIEDRLQSIEKQIGIEKTANA